MFKKTLLALTAASAVFVMSGCMTSNPIQTFNGIVPAGIDSKTIAAVVMDAGYQRNWVIQQVDENTFRATFSPRSHSITCDLVFADGRYTITYVDSVNMDAKNGEIHRNYNRWVNNLKHDIDTRLMQHSINQ